MTKYGKQYRARISKKFGDSCPLDEDDSIEFMTVYDIKEVDNNNIGASSCSMAIVVEPFSPSSVVEERKNFRLRYSEVIAGHT
ncbi:hypothetical protein TNCV_2063571 [Trichonephila clavipes]|nr:hypothetical protein TNCV_2063571 [Trichonephila clavipes]